MPESASCFPDSSASSVEFIQNDFDMETRGKKKAGVKSMPCIE